MFGIPRTLFSASRTLFSASRVLPFMVPTTPFAVPGNLLFIARGILLRFVAFGVARFMVRGALSVLGRGSRRARPGKRTATENDSHSQPLS